MKCESNTALSKFTFAFCLLCFIYGICWYMHFACITLIIYYAYICLNSNCSLFNFHRDTERDFIQKLMKTYLFVALFTNSRHISFCMNRLNWLWTYSPYFAYSVSVLRLRFFFSTYFIIIVIILLLLCAVCTLYIEHRTLYNI